MLDATFSTNQATSTEETLIESTDEGTLEMEELDEELIIEDFTIDGICGVY